MTDDSQGDLRGDQGVQTGQGVGTRDPQSSPPDFVGEGRALIAQWRKVANGITICDWEDGARAYALKLCADQLEALLTVSGVPPWHPIDTAPKDLSHVLVFDAKHDLVGEAYYREAEDEPGWIWANLAPEDEDCFVARPTQWMPLPAPPAGSGVAHQEKK